MLLSAPLAGTACTATDSRAEATEPVGVRLQAIEADPPVLSDLEKRELILKVLERFVPHAESFWRASDLTQPNTGYYAAVGSGVTQPRGAGDIAFAYVTLLAARPEQPAFGGVSREVMIDHTIQSIRHEALTSALAGAGYNRWGKGTWQASLETFSWAFAAHRLWSRLDVETRTLVQRVLEGEADILLTKPMASGEEGDTGAEDNAWNSPTPALAAVMFPDRPNKSAWETSVIQLALNASSTSADETSSLLIDGKPLGDWISTVNLHPDLTMENHGFFNPIYQQVTHVDIGDAAIAYAEAQHALPDALSFRTETVWTEILGRLATDDGDLAMTAGQDWTSKDFQHLDYIGILATRFQRADAAVLESRALELVAKRQAGFSSGSLLGQAQVGYETMLIKRLAALWWNHQLFGPSPTPSSQDYQAARAATDGVKVFPYSSFIAGRLGQAFVSMSWDTARPMGLVIPHGRANPEDPSFTYYAPLSLLGSASGTVGATSCACEKNRFSTAGSIGSRRFSMTAFEDGTTFLLDRGQGSTFTYALDDIAGLTGPRPIYFEGGSGLGDLTGAWVNAADRLGMIVRGSPGLRAASVTGSNNQIVITGATGTGSGNRGAVILPLSNHETTATLEPSVVQPETPSDWSALSGRVPDGTLRLAVARWGGPVSADLQISDERGAPLPEQEARLEGSLASFKVALESPASQGQTFRFFVSAPSALQGYQEGTDQAVLGNPNSEPVTAQVTHIGANGQQDVVERTLAAGEQVHPRLLDGETTLAGPELEPLLDARSQLEQLLDLLQQQCGKRWHPCYGAATSTLQHLRRALDAVEDAIDASESANPESAAITRKISRAEDALEGLGCVAHDRHLPAPVRSTLSTGIDKARAALDKARDQAVGVQTWLTPESSARPGEPLTLRLFVFNRGRQAVRWARVVVSGGGGWQTVQIPSFFYLRGGSSYSQPISLTAPISAVPGTYATLHTELDYRTDGDRDRDCGHDRDGYRDRDDYRDHDCDRDRDHDRATRSADTNVFVAPLFEVALDTTRLRLAAGGVNQVTAHVVNDVSRPLPITFSATAPDGAAATPLQQQVTIPALSALDLSVALAGVSRTTGVGTLLLAAASDTGVAMANNVELAFTDDLALNDVGAPWPKASATSNQSAYPPSLAFDGNASTFWVSDGTAAGQGPTPTSPKMLNVDFGAPARIGSVVMVPRVNYGPKGYSIEISNDDVTWTQIADVPNSANATVTTTFTPVITRMVRLRITGGYDRIQPPRNVQVSSLIVRAAQ